MPEQQTPEVPEEVSGRFEAIWRAAYRAAQGGAAQGAFEAERKGWQSQLQQAEAERGALAEEKELAVSGELSGRRWGESHGP